MKKQNCEHELILTDENWITDGSVRITMECQKCKETFTGMCYREWKN